MVVIRRTRSILVLTLLIISSIVITSTMNTLATDPNEVDVTIVFYKLKWFTQDSDAGKGDIYFTISHSTTQTSGVATNDYEDGPSAEYVLNNNDFDGSGYYDKEYNNIRLNVGLLDWIIIVWDEDNGDDALLFEARLTVKDTDTTGIRQFNDVWTYAEWDFPYIEVETYENSYLKFDWLDGRRKSYGNYYNGLILKVTLDYHT
ncbi:MAG: hypothetical protein HGN29_01595 [Asgard group archaeon]|nr:hypothetical protein [Asgard group archaeon]